jgi:hypothetical protein
MLTADADDKSGCGTSGCGPEIDRQEPPARFPLGIPCVPCTQDAYIGGQGVKEGCRVGAVRVKASVLQDVSILPCLTVKHLKPQRQLRLDLGHSNGEAKKLRDEGFVAASKRTL